MYEILPGILEQEWSVIERKLELVRPFAKAVHIDILDGKFAPNTTFLDPTPFKKYSQDIFFELHMMVEEPIQYLAPFADAGFRRFLGHIEKMSDQVAFVAQGQLLGEVGVYVDGPTALDELKVPFNDLDCIGIFTAKKAGFSGQPFVPEILEKVRAIRSNSAIPIEVDGGVKDITASQALEAGATRFVTTSFLYGSANPHTTFLSLQEQLNKPH